MMAATLYRLVKLFIIFITIACKVSVTCAVVPENIPLPNAGLSRIELIKMYFYQGLQYVMVKL